VGAHVAVSFCVKACAEVEISQLRGPFRAFKDFEILYTDI